MSFTPPNPVFDPPPEAAAEDGSLVWDLAHDPATFFAVSIDLLVVRDKHRRIVNANPAWETVLGWRPEEVIGRSMLELIHPDDIEPSHGHMRRMDVEEEVHGFVNRYRRRDGTYRHLEWRARRVGDLVYGVARDVTDRVALDAEMAAAKAAAEAANRAKSDFLANMSHEIRTPLNGVNGIVAALAQTELTPLQREMVGLIAISGETLERLVSDVLDFSKIEAGRLVLESRVFDLDEQLDGLLALFRLKAQEKGLRFLIHRTETARGEFHGDSVRLKQVVANLLSNAVKFTTEGEVAVAVDVRPGAGAPSMLHIEVRDTGVGFDAVFAAAMFQRFTQADGTITRRFGGSGLGLSITRALVEMMGGTISATSEPGHGSCFTVEVPLARHGTLDSYQQRVRLAPEATAPVNALQGRAAALRVLLAEDHPVNQRVVQLMLAPLGAEVTTVENGCDALEAMKDGGFDLVLMDMQMPVMDGLAATRAIRVHEHILKRPRTPVVMLSANAFEQHKLDAAEAGADAYLAKPINVAALLNCIAHVLEGPGAEISG